MAKIGGNPNVLVNVVSRRVRQLTSGGGSGRPLIDQPGTMGAADIALLELVEDKMGYTPATDTEADEENQPVAKKRRRAS